MFGAGVACAAADAAMAGYSILPTVWLGVVKFIPDKNFKTFRINEASFRTPTRKIMLCREATAALKAYTTLPQPIQGLLVRDAEKDFQLSSIITNDSTLDRLLSKIDTDTFCLSRLRVLRSRSELLGTVDGAFVVRGRAVSLGEEIVAVATVVSGTVPDELRSPSGTYFLALHPTDIVRCTQPQQIAFGTNPTTAALVPGLNYISAVFTRRVSHVVVACANGLFSLRGLSKESILGADEAERCLRNLAGCEYMIHTAEAPAAIYRVADDCLLVGPEGFDDQLQQLQRTLKLPTQEKRPDLVSSVPFILSGSLLTTGSERISSLEDLRAALPAGADVKRENLVDWWRTPSTFTLSIVIFSVEGQDTPKVLSQTSKDAQGHELRLDLKFVTLRDLRPGETEATLRSQLASIVSEAAKRILKLTQQQSELDALTEKLGNALESDLNASQLFQDKVFVKIVLKHDEATGTSVVLPSGDRAILPTYGVNPASPRLASYLGVFASLGLQGSFKDWKSAKNGMLLQ